jgi:hypothetical protein
MCLRDRNALRGHLELLFERPLPKGRLSDPCPKADVPARSQKASYAGLDQTKSPAAKRAFLSVLPITQQKTPAA